MNYLNERKVFPTAGKIYTYYYIGRATEVDNPAYFRYMEVAFMYSETSSGVHLHWNMEYISSRASELCLSGRAGLTGLSSERAIRPCTEVKG